jgi:quercetin dioxygenase-like cupin family protein
MRVLFPVVLLGIALVLVGCQEEGRTDQTAPEAVTADPDHYSVEFENDVVRLVRIRYGPGETSVMHSHPANCAVFLTDGSASMESPDGETAELPVTAGQVLCGDAEVHKPSNVGSEPFELILVELKGRETFSE